MAKLQLRILTADDVKVDEPVDMIIMRCLLEDMVTRSAMGEIGILPGHLPLSGVLGINPLRIFNEGEERIIALFGGVVIVRDDVITMMTEKALWPDEIDQHEANIEHEQALKVLEHEDDTNLRTKQIAVRRALVQMEVSSYPLVGRR